jgi:methylmalonyl-CoA mutase C-terminal domain/subunit
VTQAPAHTPYRVLVTKVGLDGHDRGVKIVARTLRDAGFEVVYGGLRQTPEMIAATAVDEDVDLVGLSMHSGSHLTLAPAVLESLRRHGSDVPVIIGGIIPDYDIERLRSIGIAEILTPGTSTADVVAAVTRVIAEHRGNSA